MAFDVGGTDIKAVLVDASGTLLGMKRVPTPIDGPQTAEAVLASIGKLAAGLTAQFPAAQPQAVGLLVPGLVDTTAGTAVFSANLGWSDFPFRSAAEALLGLPVAFGHDVTAAGIAEMELGAGQRFEDAVVIVLGTGIAGAIFVNGLPVAGGGYAGELGHALVPDPSGSGTVILESVASAAAIARRYSRAAGQAVEGARGVLQLARAGDPAAGKAWTDAIDALAFTISQCLCITGAEAVIIGGGLSEAGDDLLIPLRSRVEELLTFHRRPEILPAELGPDAGVIGAALAARSLLNARAGQA